MTPPLSLLRRLKIRPPAVYFAEHARFGESPLAAAQRAVSVDSDAGNSAAGAAAKFNRDSVCSNASAATSAAGDSDCGSESADGGRRASVGAGAGARANLMPLLRCASVDEGDEKA